MDEHDGPNQSEIKYCTSSEWNLIRYMGFWERI